MIVVVVAVVVVVVVLAVVVVSVVVVIVFVARVAQAPIPHRPYNGCHAIWRRALLATGLEPEP